MKAYSKAIFSIFTAFLCVASLAACQGQKEQAQLVAGEAAVMESPPAEQENPPAAAKRAEYDNTIATHKAGLDSAMDEIAARYGVLGFSVAAFEHDIIFYRYSGGTASRQRGTETNCFTKFRVASVSKVVTTMLAMTLVEQGKLSLDADIAELLDEPLRNPTYFSEKITIEHLLTHTSGIVDSLSYENAIATIPYPPLGEVLRGNVFSESRPGGKCVYSNLGLGLVAGAVEQASGQYFYDYARDTFFKPMGIDAAFLTDYMKDKESIAGFFSDDPLNWGPMKDFYSRIPQGKMYLIGHGDLYISAEDLARFAIILAGDGSYRGKQYLAQETLDDIHTERAREEETGTVRGLAVAIFSDVIENTKLYGHEGNAYGAICGMFYDPISGQGVVFLTNGASTERASNGAYAVNDAVVKAIWKYL